MMKLPIILPAFLIFLIGLIGCNEVVEPDPVAQFEISKKEGDLYAGSGFIVMNKSLNASNIKWDFGDGTLAQDTIFQHAYREKGEYTLSLTACNSSGCNDLSVRLVVKDSMINLVAGRDSQTWYLTSWIDRNGNPVAFDTCSCLYSHTFSRIDMPSDYSGKHQWLKNGPQICDNNPIRCFWYDDPQGHGWFNLNLNPLNITNNISIGQRHKLGYQITVDENQLSLRNNSTIDWFYYKKK